MLTKLIKRKDVDRLINACDAGREGELIFRYIVQHAKAKQPIQRLWLQSMTPARSATALRICAPTRTCSRSPTRRAAAREADWLVGINGTRAMTAFNSKTGGFFLTTVGRVQTPTLAILVEREEKIHKFVPRDYWEVHGEFVCAKPACTTAAGSMRNSSATTNDPEKRERALGALRAAEAIVATMSRQARHRHGRKQADDATVAAAL